MRNLLNVRKQNEKYAKPTSSYQLKIQQLLRSNNQQNVKLAFYLMKGNGVPRILLSYLRTQFAELCFETGLMFPLYKLKYLYLGNNKFDEIPPEVAELQNLKGLYVENNFLEGLPEEITRLRKLRVLWLESNDIKKLPEDIGHMKGLRDLRLGYNQIKQLPTSLGKLKNLQELFLEHNKLKTLPIEVTKLQKLRVLRLDNQHLGKIYKVKYIESFWKSTQAMSRRSEIFD